MRRTTAARVCCRGYRCRAPENAYPRTSLRRADVAKTNRSPKPGAERKLPKGQWWRRPPANRRFPERGEDSRRQTRSQWHTPAAAFFLPALEVPKRQWSVSWGLGESSGSSSSSLKMGSETTYFSVAQLPRSRMRQRSLQKG